VEDVAVILAQARIRGLKGDVILAQARIHLDLEPFENGFWITCATARPE
jgi:hypothetical protein